MVIILRLSSVSSASAKIEGKVLEPGRGKEGKISIVIEGKENGNETRELISEKVTRTEKNRTQNSTKRRKWEKKGGSH